MGLTFGMVGGGGISQKHVQGAAKGAGARLVAGCFSRSDDKNRAYAAQNGVDLSRAYPSFSIMAEKEAARPDRPDFMVVTTTNNSHYPITKAFLEAGFPVVCDKPLAISNAEADKLVELAAKKDLPCCTTFTFACSPYVHLMKALFEEGAIGDLYYVTARFFLGIRLAGIMRGEKFWRWDPAISGNAGTIGDLGAHLEYLLRMVTGQDWSRVLARLIAKPGDIKLDSTATALLETKNGLNGTLMVAQLACGYDHDLQVELLGTRGSLIWNYANPFSLRLEQLDGRTITYRRLGLTHPALEKFPERPGMDAFSANFAHVYSAYCAALEAKRNDGKPGWYPTFEDGRKGVRFIQACVTSHQQGNVWIEM